MSIDERVAKISSRGRMLTLKSDGISTSRGGIVITDNTTSVGGALQSRRIGKNRLLAKKSRFGMIYSNPLFLCHQRDIKSSVVETGIVEYVYASLSNSDSRICRACVCNITWSAWFLSLHRWDFCTGPRRNTAIFVEFFVHFILYSVLYPFRSSDIPTTYRSFATLRSCSLRMETFF
jgi:hypothetical protein